MNLILCVLAFACVLRTTQCTSSDNGIIPPKVVLDGDNYYFIGSDEFSLPGMPNSQIWMYDLGYIANDEKQWYTMNSKNVYVSQEGELHIVALRESVHPQFNYTSTRLKSQLRFCVTEGSVVQVRAKLPSGVGTWPAIWLLNEENIWPSHGEIDIVESVGFQPGVAHHTIHTRTHNAMINTQYTTHESLNESADEFHTFSVAWKASGVHFFVDESQVFSVGRDAADWPFDSTRCMNMILNLAIGGAWGGQHGINDTIFPVEMVVDHVRLYHRNNATRFLREPLRGDFMLAKCTSITQNWTKVPLSYCQQPIFDTFMSNISNVDGCDGSHIFTATDGFLYALPGGAGWDIELRNKSLTTQSGIVPTAQQLKAWNGGNAYTNRSCCVWFFDYNPTQPPPIPPTPTTVPTTTTIEPASSTSSLPYVLGAIGVCIIAIFAGVAFFFKKRGSISDNDTLMQAKNYTTVVVDEDAKLKE